MRILIVDDSQDDRTLLRYLIENRGHETIEAFDGADGLRKAKSESPDLIISDGLMPVMDGFHLLRSLKLDQALCSIPFIFYSSSYKEEQDFRLAASLGADAYILKPVEPSELWERIQRILEQRNPSGERVGVVAKDETGFLKKYSEVVARKLEKKVLQLEKALADERRAEELLQNNERRLYTLIQTIPDLVWVKDVDGVYLCCNPTFERFFGAPESEIIGKTDHDFVAKELADFSREQDRLAIAAGGPCVHEEWLTFADGGYRGLFETIKTPMRDASGVVTGVLGIARDISERHLANEQLRIAATAFEAQEGILITDAEEKILRVNSSFSQITGYMDSDVIGQTPRLLKSERHDKAFYEEMWAGIQRWGHWQGEIWNRRKSGEIHPEWISISAVKDAQNTVTHYVGSLIDITSRKAAEKVIEHLAYYDPLTNLPNRRLLIDRMQQAMASNLRSSRMGALLFLDLDNFKILNDTSGHDVGDQLLIEVSKRLAECVREIDTISRLGGDEFVIMLMDLDRKSQEAAKQAKQIGEKILSVLNQVYSFGRHEFHSSPSIGVALFKGTELSVDELLKQADIAMYQAKSAGKNTLRFFDPEMQTTLALRANLEVELRLGIKEGQFALFYQPQIHSQHGLIGAEALLRWIHPNRGIVPPAQFIPIAEETGLILPIGNWVLATACAQLKKWADDPRTSQLTLAINVSSRQFRQPDFVEQFSKILETSGASIKRLKLELTESMILDDIENTIEKMQQLKQLGIGFSMDDFGTGYSSLSYLTRLPLDQLKIDQSFVRNLPANSNDAVIAQTIITMAKSLGLTVIAEGVESEAQRDFLSRNGCSTYQGYLFSQPLNLVDFENFINGARQ